MIAIFILLGLIVAFLGLMWIFGYGVNTGDWQDRFLIPSLIVLIVVGGATTLYFFFKLANHLATLI
jgi:type IV secretory pathway VirB2 component (pilin)